MSEPEPLLTCRYVKEGIKTVVLVIGCGISLAGAR